MAISELSIKLSVKKRPWFWPCFIACKMLTKMGAKPEPMADWLTRHAMKIEHSKVRPS